MSWTTLRIGQTAITMQHSQDTAWRMLTWSIENGLIKPQEPVHEWLRNEMEAGTQFLYAMVKEAQDAAS